MRAVAYILVALLLILAYVYQEQTGRYYRCIVDQRTVCVLDDPLEE